MNDKVVMKRMGEASLDSKSVSQHCSLLNRGGSREAKLYSWTPSNCDYTVVNLSALCCCHKCTLDALETFGETTTGRKYFLTGKM